MLNQIRQSHKGKVSHAFYYVKTKVKEESKIVEWDYLGGGETKEGGEGKKRG